METFIAVVNWNNQNRIIKQEMFGTEQEAVDFVSNLTNFPDAFVSPTIEGGLRDWLVDPVAKTLTYDPVIDVNSPIITFEEFEQRFTVPEWDDATDLIYAVNTGTGLPKNKKLIQGLARVQARNSVDLLDPKTDAFLSILVSGGVINEARKTQILTP